jgi:tetratricopeptide (TPR) repeat protein
MPASVRRFDSLKAVCLHLFRNLSDARSLRANPLTAEFCRDCPDDRQVVEQLRELLTVAVQQFVESAPHGAAAKIKRTASIVARCDLGGEAHKVVAADLGLSMRQFYRERVRAIVEIGGRLEGLLLPRPSETKVFAFDGFTLEMRRAVTLAHAGCASNAIALLRRLMTQVQDPLRQVRARTALAEMLIESNLQDEAVAEIDAARHLAARLDERVECTEAYAAIGLATSVLSNVRGELAKARATFERALVHLHDPVAHGSRNHLELFVHGKILDANLEIKEGHAQRALASLAVAQQAMAAFEDLPPTTSVEYFMHLHEASVTAVSETQAAQAYQRVLALSQTNGFATDATIAAMYRAQYLIHGGDRNNAVVTARQALDIGNGVMTEYQYALLQMLVGELEIEASCNDAAIERMRNARTVLQTGGADWARAVMLEASGQLGRGDFAGAVHGSTTALQTFRNLGNERWAGTSLRIMAEGYAGLGRVAEAKETVALAVHALEGCGHPNALLRAYDASARISGNRAHARTARELRGALYRSAVDVT